jgi:site-specific DNA-methyltransferase (adenine-specific)
MNPKSEVFNIDCLEGMKGYPDKYFDLGVVDPPTGQDEGKKHATRDTAVKQKNGSVLHVTTSHIIKEWDMRQPDQEYFDELFRVCKYVIIMCEPNLHFKQKNSSSGRIVWNLLRDVDFSVCQIMWTNLFERVDYFEYKWNGFMQGVGINSRVPIGNKELNEVKIHPSQKPAIVYRYMFMKYAMSGWKVLSTHVGSGSDRIGAETCGLDLDFIGYEIDADYFAAQEKRFHQHKAQLGIKF